MVYMKENDMQSRTMEEMLKRLDEPTTARVNWTTIDLRCALGGGSRNEKKQRKSL